MKKFSLSLILLLILFVHLGALEYKYKPLKSAMLSLFIPGGGQFYNDKKLKSAIVASGELALIFKLSYDLNKKNFYEKRYKNTHSQTDYTNFSKYYNKKQSDIFWLGFYVMLSATDAFVDAHLYNFKKKKKEIHLLFSFKKMEVSYVF